MTATIQKEKKESFAALRQAARFMSFASRNSKALRARAQIESIRSTLALANMELGKLGYQHPAYARRVWEFDQQMIELTKGKWFATRAMDAGQNADWRSVLAQLQQAKAGAERLYEALLSGKTEPLPIVENQLSNRGSEILFAGDVPLVPPINPIVVLRGSDFEMGRQYARQVIAIFGQWVFLRRAGRPFSEGEKKELRQWEAQIRQHAPEILGFCEGWSAGATEAGVSMTYDDVLNIWTGCRPPSTEYFGLDDGLPDDLYPPACSGHAAWGRATRDGQLVTGSSGDHDCGYMVTIVAYPETGHPFIYTPFSVTGDLPKIGPTYMMGHPGMNNQGLAYVHHGGAPKMVEPRRSWGYGLRLGTAVFHILRFASNLEEARQMELSFPIGDVGDFSGVGYSGGFWADASGAFIVESREDPLILRAAGNMGETDFLFSNNSALSAEVQSAGWLQANRENWAWDAHAGWFPKKLSFARGLSAVGKEAQIQSLFAFIYINSFGRSQYSFERMNKAPGQIDADFMLNLYRTLGTIPQGDWKTVEKTWRATGEWGQYSTGHASNALVTIMQPRRGDHGSYAVCVGTARRGMAPHSPSGATPIFGETNAFWELQLSGCPSEMAISAQRTAQADISKARAGMQNIKEPAYSSLKKLLDIAESELADGKTAQANAQREDAIDDWAKAIRAFTRAQVRARQVLQALEPA